MHAPCKVVHGSRDCQQQLLTHHNLLYFLVLNLHLECSLLQLELLLFWLYLLINADITTSQKNTSASAVRMSNT